MGLSFFAHTSTFTLDQRRPRVHPTVHTTTTLTTFFVSRNLIRDLKPNLHGQTTEDHGETLAPRACVRESPLSWSCGRAARKVHRTYFVSSPGASTYYIMSNAKRDLKNRTNIAG